MALPAVSRELEKYDVLLLFLIQYIIVDILYYYFPTHCERQVKSESDKCIIARGDLYKCNT